MQKLNFMLVAEISAWTIEQRFYKQKRYTIYRWYLNKPPKCTDSWERASNNHHGSNPKILYSQRKDVPYMMWLVEDGCFCPCFEGGEHPAPNHAERNLNPHSWRFSQQIKICWTIWGLLIAKPCPPMIWQTFTLYRKVACKNNKYQSFLSL